MQRWRSIFLTASCAVFLSGCSSWWGRNTSGVGSAKSETYSQYSSDYQQRSLVAPSMGLDNNLEPSETKKIGTAVAAVPSKVGSSVKDGYVKLASWGSSTTTTDVTSADAGATTGSSWFFAKKEKSTPELHVATARIYERAANYEAATKEYEAALKISPNNVPAILSYAHLLDHQGKLPDATKLYQRAIKANPNEAAAYNDLGLCYARRGLASDSLANLAKAVALQPDKALYRNNLAVVLVDQRRADDALAQLRAVNSEAVANYNLGILLQQRQQDALAQTHFQRALELEPNFVEARECSQMLAQRAQFAAASAPQMAYRAPAQAPVAYQPPAPPPPAANQGPPSYAVNQAPPSYAVNQPAAVPPVANQAPPQPRLASIPTTMPRPGSYGIAPDPTSAGLANSNVPGIPPIPSGMPMSQAAGGVEMRYLPSVQ